MKELILKSDGTPCKSKVGALSILKSRGIEAEIFEENGEFYYEAQEPVQEEQKEPLQDDVKNTQEPVTWDIQVYKGDKNTQFELKGNPTVEVTILRKNPAGQSARYPKNSFGLKIDGEEFVMSLDLCKKLFYVK